MKINEVEQAIGITKKNIRFYEQEGLLKPSRNLSNGYRDYSKEDLETLRQIKLLRKLDIPLEEIRRMQSDDLSLDDCLHRHLIALGRKQKNLEANIKFCHRLLSENARLDTLDMQGLLTEMEHLEKGGTKFMDIQKRDKQQRKKGALTGALCAILFMTVFLGILLWAAITNPATAPPLLILVLLFAIPILGIIGTLIALRERFREIEGGELDEASKY
ncbi:MAG: MerR family transcriptional regulator [Lachnospiraceae bacterium]|nr:MerR family transcriptional regulator [Lachnospiraceae bacterium]MCM1304063.1 MerR family transcriptional regulator [Butyrivibrio sp.]MCM1343575.1 MerR family transcriptional regulator [Muribaculaceae bacterium]MCM1411256.1 MerR family transcriptional regulator [Lachnospiraceae bacterium]